MLDDIGARGRNIMEYVRHLEGRVTELRGIQSRFKLFSFVSGVAVGVLLSIAWRLLIFLHKS